MVTKVASSKIRFTNLLFYRWRRKKNLREMNKNVGKSTFYFIKLYKKKK